MPIATLLLFFPAFQDGVMRLQEGTGLKESNLCIDDFGRARPLVFSPKSVGLCAYVLCISISFSQVLCRSARATASVAAVGSDILDSRTGLPLDEVLLGQTATADPPWQDSAASGVPSRECYGKTGGKGQYQTEKKKVASG
jgi:hypothetical protein